MLFKKTGKVNFITLPKPDNSSLFFEKIKMISEQYWATSRLNDNLYGFQIQENTKWRTGLNNTELLDFEKDMGFSFPQSLINFYKVMNGLNKPGINIYGNSGVKPSFHPVFYSYPEDINLIKESVKWIYDDNSISENELINLGISRIFPIYQHRFMLIDIPGNPILSMHGNDIIYWADDLSKLLANELFGNIYNAHDFENLKQPRAVVKFWLDEE